MTVTTAPRMMMVESSRMMALVDLIAVPALKIVVTTAPRMMMAELK